MSQIEWENLASLLSLVVGAVAAVLLVAGWIPVQVMGSAERRFIAFSRTPLIWFILLPTLSFTLNLLIAVHHRGVPLPLIHDEFSYLLAADTFAHGRVTNPPPAFWEHFETPQQLVQPTYMSKYPPGQGLALALGQVISGEPIVGAWVSTAAAVAAIYWMLFAFVSPPWALVGGIVAAVNPQLLDWSQNYWGGSVAVLGGALLLGSWGRLMLTTTASSAVTLAMGLIILANSRPYEGLVLCIPLMIALLIRTGNHWKPLLMGATIPLLIAAVAMGYYNFRITGHVLRLPFAEYTAQYDVYPKLWIMPMRPIPAYRNPAMEFIHRYFERGSYAAFHTGHELFDVLEARFLELFTTNVKLSVLLLPLVVAMFIHKQQRLVWVWIAIGGMVLALWLENFVFPHYQAPMFPAVLLLTVIGWRRMNSWMRRGRPLGQPIARATLLGFLAGAAMAAAQPIGRDSLLVEQQALVNLEPALQNGRQLVFVTYGPMHSYHIEYVHNLSDLDDSRIIWARSFGPASDLAVARHYSGRQTWLLYVGGKLQLNPYLTNDQLPTTAPATSRPME